MGESEENENISSQETDEYPKDDKFKYPQDESQLEKKSSFTWRVDLCKSEPHGKSWFEGLSSKFLSVSASKLLLLAGVDRLDRDLTVGQMQGNFKCKFYRKQVMQFTKMFQKKLQIFYQL